MHSIFMWKNPLNSWPRRVNPCTAGVRIWAVLSCLLWLTGCASLPKASDIPLKNTVHTIYVIHKGFHTSLLLDARTLAAHSTLLAPKLRGEKYARIGFGDGDYFTGKSKSVASATKALVASGYSAVQLLTYDYEPFDEIPADTIVRIAITYQGMQHLANHIDHSILLTPQNQPAELAAMGDSMGYFYQGKPHYSMLNNCNTWTSEALRAAGLPVANRLTATGTFQQAKAISNYQRAAGLFARAVP